MNLKRAFEPVADAQTRLLILGSLPGDASLRAGEYYGHPRNAFWRLSGAVVARDLATMAYADRLEALRDSGVGLWDVIARARRAGSLDAAIRDAEASDLTALIGRLPSLRAVAFNGAKAARIGRRSLAALKGVDLIDLPSSSPAHTLPFESKLQAWRPLSRFLITD